MSQKINLININLKIKEIISNYDHVIWDWNGTLVDDVDLAVEAINVLLTDQGLTQLNAIEYREIFGFPVKNYYEKLGFDFEKKSFEKLCDHFIDEYNDKRASSAPLFDGILELLREIKLTKTQSILSAASQWHLDEMTEHFMLSDSFHFRYGINDHYASSKLERGRQLITISGVSIDKTIMIGDTDHDFEVAKELGIACLLIADGHQSHQRLSHLTDNVLMGRRKY